MKNPFLYIIFHWAMHFVFIVTPLLILNYGTSIIFIALLAGILIDLDHLLIAPIKKWRMHLEADTSRKLPLHNYIVLSISFLLSFTIVFNKIIGSVFLGIFLHLLWDLVEDILIFRMRLEHWKI